MQRIIEPVAMGGMESAYIMINCELGSEDFVIEQLKSIPGIKEVQGVFGNYDILVKIQTQSIESLREISLSFKSAKFQKFTVLQQ